MRNLIALCIILGLSALSVAYTPYSDDEFVDVHDASTLSPLAPEDPAIHSFPTVPTVPLVPTCVKEGYFRDPFNCRKFYYCQYADAVPAGFYCQSDLIFNTVTNRCDAPERVQC